MDFVDPILSLASEIYQLVENVKANRKRCREVSEQVKALEGLVKSIKQSKTRQVSSEVEKALKELCKTLEDTQRIIRKYTTANLMKRVIKQRGYKDKLNDVKERLKDAIRILSVALQVEQRDLLWRMLEREDQRDGNKCKCSHFCIF